MLRTSYLGCCSRTVKVLIINGLAVVFLVNYLYNSSLAVEPAMFDIQEGQGHNDSLDLDEHNATKSKTKTILIWNGKDKFELNVFGAGRDAFVSHSCPVNDCYITRNKSYAPLEDFDAVIFNMPTLSRSRFPWQGPRRSEQRYVFFSQEAPVYVGQDLSQYGQFYSFSWASEILWQVLIQMTIINDHID